MLEQSTTEFNAINDTQSFKLVKYQDVKHQYLLPIIKGRVLIFVLLKIINCMWQRLLLLLKEGRPTGTISLQWDDNLENDIASWRSSKTVRFLLWRFVCEPQPWTAYSKTGIFVYSSTIFSKNSAATAAIQSHQLQIEIPVKTAKI